jgi:hypothetical protein
MTRLSLFVFVCASVIASLANAAPADLWDPANGTVVTADSGTADFYVPHATNIANMFMPKQTPAVSDDPQNTLFAEMKPAGFVHYVEWQTPSPVTLTSFALYSVDGAPAFVRSFDRFTLYAWDGTAFQPLFQDLPSHPYAFVDPSQDLLYQADVGPITASRFRAEFVQNGTETNAYLGYTTYGPRIIQLAGYGSSVPEPTGTCGAALSAAASLLIRRARRRKTHVHATVGPNCRVLGCPKQAPRSSGVFS